MIQDCNVLEDREVSVIQTKVEVTLSVVSREPRGPHVRSSGLLLEILWDTGDQLGLIR